MSLKSWLRLTPRARRELHAALVEAFPTRPDVETLVALSANVTLDQIAGPEAPVDTALLKVIGWFSKKDALNDLLIEARRQNPTNQALALAAKHVGPSGSQNTALDSASAAALGLGAMLLVFLTVWGSRPLPLAHVLADLTVERASFLYIPTSEDVPLFSHTPASRLILSAFASMTLPAGTLTPCQSGVARASLPLTSGSVTVHTSSRLARVTVGPARLAELTIPFASLLTLEPFTDTLSEDCTTANPKGLQRSGTMLALKGAGGAASIRFGPGATLQCDGCSLHGIGGDVIKLKSGQPVRAEAPPQMPVAVTGLADEFVVGIVPEQKLGEERFHAKALEFCGRAPDARRSSIVSGVLRFPGSEVWDIPIDGESLRLGDGTFGISNVRLGSSSPESKVQDMLALTIEGDTATIGTATDCRAASMSRMPLRWPSFTNRPWLLTAGAAAGIACAVASGALTTIRLRRRRSA